MSFPFRVALGVTVGTIAAFLLLKLVFAVLAGLVGLILSVVLPVVIIGAIIYLVLRVCSPRALGMLRRLGR